MKTDLRNEGATASRLRRSKLLANTALIAAAVGFIVTHWYESRHPALGYLRAFCEAAMVGALADWFAVTALFRRPLGLPIPHTAIIPANKDRLGGSLGQFVQTNFLSEEVLSAKLSQSDIAGMAARWLCAGDNAAKLSSGAVRLLPDLVASLNDDDLKRFLHDSLKRTLAEIDLADAAAKVLELLVSHGKHQIVLEELLKGAEHALGAHQRFLQNVLLEELPWYVPEFVHRRIYRSVVSRLLKRIGQMRADPTHQAREQFSKALLRFAVELQSRGPLRTTVEEIKAWALTTPALSEYVEKLWGDLKQIAAADAVLPDSAIVSAGVRLLRAGAAGMLRDDGARLKINLMLGNNVRRAVSAFGDAFIELIAGTVRKWDTQTLVGKLEFEVGRDLQYIRLNGTIVGGLVGVLLHALAS